MKEIKGSITVFGHHVVMGTLTVVPETWRESDHIVQIKRQLGYKFFVPGLRTSVSICMLGTKCGEGQSFSHSRKKNLVPRQSFP